LLWLNRTFLKKEWDNIVRSPRLLSQSLGENKLNWTNTYFLIEPDKVEVLDVEEVRVSRAPPLTVTACAVGSG
jgi:hypothetical protein